MRKRNFSFLFPLFAIVILIFALSQKMFNAPPLGKLLDPFTGLVQNDNDESLNKPVVHIKKMGLSDSVHVYFDARKVPHIYAANEEDMYFAQGYVTAGLRLWQMDFLTYASAGRLSELFSEGFVDYDRTQRRIGILDAAKASLKMIEKDIETSKIITAYTKGVNAYISQLSYKDFPPEYKLIDYEPEPWTNLKTVLIMKYMANTLSGYEEDFSMSNIMVALGEEKFNKYFPDFISHITPVMNTNTGQLKAVDPYIKKPDYLDYSFLSGSSLIPQSSYNPKLGSNSWAVSGKKTKSGFPILCNDPHLNLSLPCVWLEMQLSSPGINVYGVSIPGTPAIIIGFNEDVAWGITNGAEDVRDYYKLKITENYKKYKLDGKWVDLTFSIEEIKRRNQPSISDTIYHTVHGPLVYDKGFPGRKQEQMNYALRWELQKPSNEFLTFIKLNKARTYPDYKEAIQHYACPIQNFTFACKNNDIAVNHQGNMAIKTEGEGKFLLDGTKTSKLYTNYIPQDSLPHLFNPSCNYVLSANQHPTNQSYPFYYNGYYSETRANRIKQLLEKENSFDISMMQAMQLDNTNFFAVDALPVLLTAVNKDKLNVEQKKLLDILSTWKGTYDWNDENAKLYELWWRNIKQYTWDEFKEFSFFSRAPENYILLDLIEKEPCNDYFDKQGTSAKETAADIILQAFIVAADDFYKLKKEGSIKWGNLNKVSLMHLSNIEAFSVTNIPSAGYSEAINAMSAKWGPSWRMIVELGDRPKGYGVYPGGQSGNFGSKYYNNFTTDWNIGNYFPLIFFMYENEARKQTTNAWILK